MRSLESRFDKELIKDPKAKTFPLLVRTVKNQKYHKLTIAKWFSKLVDLIDYDKKDKKDLLKYLQEQTDLKK